MLTSIGRFLRKLRIDNGEILKDMAEALGVSSAFLSAVENGKKKMPEGWIEKLKSIYSFTAEQAEELQAAVIDTNDAVELNLQNATPGNRALAISFAREFDSLDDETSKKIFEIPKRRKGGLTDLVIIWLKRNRARTSEALHAYSESICTLMMYCTFRSWNCLML
jgi:transcriptional regulator with XRE-family HTH domain